MSRYLVVLAVVLTVPAVALGAKPPAPGSSQNNHGKAAPKVLYVLRGTLTAYGNPGTVTIVVNGANHGRAQLKGQTLTFTVTAATKFVSKSGSFTANDSGIVKVRAQKKLGPNDTYTSILQAQPAWQVIDQGAAG